MTVTFNPLPDNKILDWSKLKQFADDNFKFDENSTRSSKRVENTVGKGEIARYEQFLVFPQCFQKAWFPGVSKGVIVWEWVKRVENTTGKWENAGYNHFIFFNVSKTFFFLHSVKFQDSCGKDLQQTYQLFAQ